jgi:uncharacterized protein with FMN-binding domain
MLVVATAMLLWGCIQGFRVQTGYLPAYGPWNDGTYTTIQDLPTPQLLVVQVDIAQDQIVAIRLLQHPAWTAPQEQELLLRNVLTRQTTTVYEPRNDGSEQDLLLHAIEEALYKARREMSSAP